MSCMPLKRGIFRSVMTKLKGCSCNACRGLLAVARDFDGDL